MTKSRYAAKVGERAPVKAVASNGNGEPHGLDVKVEKVTPEMAEDLLKRNPRNRTLKTAKLMQYRRDMEAGNWLLTGEPIQFDRHGNLTNGQHRLTACIMAGVPFTTLVVRGVDPETIFAQDSGATRQLRDHLRIMGESDTTVLAAIIRLALIWEKGFMSGGLERAFSPTTRECLAWLSNNPTVRESISPANHFKGNPFHVPTSVMGAFHYRLASLFPEEFEVFLIYLREGTNLREGDPILALRRLLSNWNGLPGQRTQREYLAILIKAFSHWMEGRQVRNLSWRPGGAAPEPFPILPAPLELSAATRVSIKRKAKEAQKEAVKAGQAARSESRRTIYNRTGVIA